MLPGQLDLFGNPTLPSTGIVGLQLRLPSACHCGCDIVVIGGAKAMHSAGIRCSQCSVHRGRLSHTEFERIGALVSESGRPTGPIDIRARS